LGAKVRLKKPPMPDAPSRLVEMGTCDLPSRGFTLNVVRG